jgi:PhnB protein
MSKVSIYLNFMGNTEEAFNFYKKVFKAEFSSPFQRMKDVPPDPNMPPLAEDEKDKILHVALPILNGTEIMGTDMLKSMGHELRIGNNTTISLQPDSLDECKRLYSELSEGSSDKMDIQKMFWGAWWGTCLDKYGIRWMFNFPEESK